MGSEVVQRADQDRGEDIPNSEGWDARRSENENMGWQCRTNGVTNSVTKAKR